MWTRSRKPLKCASSFWKCVFQGHNDIPQMYGLDMPFGVVMKNMREKVLAGTNIGNKEIRTKIAEV